MKIRKFTAMAMSFMMATVPCTAAFAEEVTDEIAEEITEEETIAVDEDGIADISSSMVGSWIGNDSSIYTFYDDGSFYNYDASAEENHTGYYALQTDGENTVLSMADEAEYVSSVFVTADTEANTLTIYNPEDGSELDQLSPYQVNYLTGSYQDAEGGVFVFYKDGSFYYEIEDTAFLGQESIQTVGDVTLFVMNIDSEEESATSMYVIEDGEEGSFVLTGVNDDSEESLTPYELELEEGAVDYQAVAELLDYAYIGQTDDNTQFCYATSEDGSFGYVLACDEDYNYVSFVGETSVLDEENGVIGITDEASGVTLSFSVEDMGEGSYLLDMGDLGSAAVTQAHISNAVYALSDCIANGTEMEISAE